MDKTNAIAGWPLRSDESKDTTIMALGTPTTAMAHDNREKDLSASGKDAAQQGVTAAPEPSQPSPPYSVFTNVEKKSIILLVSFMALISPFTAAVYLPAIPEISRDLNVSPSLVNLTITTYMIFQGIAPSFIGNFSDSYGRRPAYMICSLVYLGANVGLALNDTYAGLMVLRCLQSCGSSATVALASGTIADMVTRAERGKYIALALMGVSLGPALGPVAGGLITNRWGWRAIFWFLTALSGSLFALVFLFLPETCRCVAGNGSLPVPWWNMSLVAFLRQRRKQLIVVDETSKRPPRKRPNPLSSLKILGHRTPCMLLGFGSLMYSGYFAVLTTLPDQLTKCFGFSSVIIGLCFLPIAFGTILTRFVIGPVIDKNFARHAAKAHYVFDKSRQQDISKMNIERARLEISLPLLYLSCIAILAYGWTLHSESSSLAGIEVCLFFCGLFFQGSLNGFNVLVVDLNRDQPATATAANNLFRCLMGAGAVAVATPTINRIGMGWTGVLIAGIWMVFSPFVWLVLLRGYEWRKQKAEKALSVV